MSNEYTEWIPVSERLPLLNKWNVSPVCIVATDAGFVFEAQWSHGKWVAGECQCYEADPVDGVTHWRAFPIHPGLDK